MHGRFVNRILESKAGFGRICFKLPEVWSRDFSRADGCYCHHTCVLVPKLRLGNPVSEALASRLGKLELPDCIPKLELGNERKFVAFYLCCFMCCDIKVADFKRVFK
jgi:hypothetical protein